MKVNIKKPINYFGPYQLASFLFCWYPKKKEVIDGEVFKEEADFISKIGDFLAYKNYDWDKRWDELKTGEILEDLEYEPTTLSRFLEWIHNKRLEFNKPSIKIESHDTWNADSTLSPIIIELLKKFKKEKVSAAIVDNEDLPEYLKSPEGVSIDDVDFELRKKQWDYILDEMIRAFEMHYDESWEDQFYKDLGELKYKKLKNGYTEMLFEGMEVDQEGLNKERERIQRGLVYFGKYFRNLWS